MLGTEVSQCELGPPVLFTMGQCWGPKFCSASSRALAGYHQVNTTALAVGGG